MWGCLELTGPITNSIHHRLEPDARLDHEKLLQLVKCLSRRIARSGKRGNKRSVMRMRPREREGLPRKLQSSESSRQRRRVKPKKLALSKKNGRKGKSKNGLRSRSFSEKRLNDRLRLRKPLVCKGNGRQRRRKLRNKGASRRSGLPRKRLKLRRRGYVKRKKTESVKDKLLRRRDRLRKP
jgi:hypothetical protein